MLRRILLLLIIVLSVPIAANLIVGSVPVHQTTINPDTVSDLQLAERYGTGSMNEVVAFSPVDERIAVGGSRGVYIFDTLDAEPELVELFQSDETPFNVTSLLFSPDGNTLFAGNGEKILAYDLLEQTILYHVEDAERVLSFNHDGSLLLYEMVHGVNVLDIASGEVVRVLSYEGEWGEESSPEDNYYAADTVEYVQFMADEEQLILKHHHASSAGVHGEIRNYTDIWTGASHERAETVFEFIPRYAHAIAETDDGFFYALYEGQIYTENSVSSLFDEDTDIRTLLFDSISFSSDKTIFAMQYTRIDHDYNRVSEIGVWNAITLEQPVTIEIDRWADSLTLSPDGALLAIGHDVYDVATGEHLRTLAVDSYELIRSGYERVLQYGDDGNLYLLDTRTMSELSIIGQNDQIPLYSSPEIDTDNPEIMWLSLYGDDGFRDQIRISLETGAIQGNFIGEEISYLHRTVSPDGTYIVFDDYNLSGELWYLENASRVDLPGDTQLIQPYFTANNLLLLYHSELSEIWFFDIEANHPVITIPIDYADIDVFYYVDLSTDRQRMLLVHYSREQRGYLATVYDIHNDTLTQAYEVPTDFVESSMSGDGSLIAIISDRENSELSIIDIENDELLIQDTLDYIPEYFSLSSTSLYVDYSWDYWTRYTWESGELVEETASTVSSEPYPILRTDTMHFYQDGTILRIAATDGLTLREIDMGRYFYPIVLSDDGQRLWIDFTDGTVELWTIQQ